MRPVQRRSGAADKQRTTTVHVPASGRVGEGARGRPSHEGAGAVGEGAYAGEGAVVAQEPGGQGPDRVAADLLGRRPFGGQEGPVAAVGLAPLVEGAGHVDPVPGPSFGGGQGGGVDAAGELDGLARVAEQVADGDPVEEDLTGAEDTAAELRVAAEPPAVASASAMRACAVCRSPCLAAV